MAIRVTQGSRTSFAPRPSDIPEVRTRVPEQRFIPTSSASASALQTLGGSITKVGDAFATVGAINQARDEDREVQAKKIALSQFVRDRTFGNKAAGIRGYTQDRGQTAIDNRIQFEDDLKAEIQRVGSSSASPRVNFGFAAEAATIQASSLNAQARHVAAQRDIAEVATDEAEAFIAAQSFLDDPGGPDGDTHFKDVTRSVLKSLDRQGITDKGARAKAVKEVLSKLMRQAIEKQLEENTPASLALAQKLFLDPDTQAILTEQDEGDLSKLVQTANVTASAQRAFDILISTNPGATEKQLQGVVRATHTGEVRKELTIMVRLFGASQERDLRQQDRRLIADAVAKARAGFKQPLTAEEDAVVSKTLGMAGRLQKIAERKRSGRPFISDGEIKGDLYHMRRTDPEKFMELNFADEPYASGLSETDVDKFETLAAGIRGVDARAATKDRENAKKGARRRNIISGAGSVVNGFFTSDQKEERGLFEDRLVDEVERLTEDGVKFTKDSQYREIARQLFLQGEETGGAFLLEDPDIKASQEQALARLRWRGLSRKL